MVMIPGTDLRLGNNHRVEIKTQNIGIIHQKIEAEIQCAQGQDEGDRYPVRGMFKHLQLFFTAIFKNSAADYHTNTAQVCY